MRYGFGRPPPKERISPKTKLTKPFKPSQPETRPVAPFESGTKEIVQTSGTFDVDGFAKVPENFRFLPVLIKDDETRDLDTDKATQAAHLSREPGRL